MLRALLILAAAALVALAIFHPVPHPPAAVTAAPTGSPSVRRAHKPIVAASADTLVYVVGAVARPGLYRVRPDARVDDAVRAAGGLRSEADPAGVNLAAHLSDGEEIDVPVLGQPGRIASNAKRTRAPRSRKPVLHARVDVNSATVEMLATVPGIGPTIAARIVEIRERDGAFATFDELLDVAGMTQSRLERAEPYLHL